jgi:hypothetical protein
MVNCYLFDIDGTLADCSHRLHHIQKLPKDWDSFFAACSQDAPIAHMLRLIRSMTNGGRDLIVFVSGRSDQCRSETVDWLDRHIGFSDPLYMRRAGDHRDDDIVKGELLDQIVADGYQPIMAFDDRSRVVDMWRKRGVPCAQVAPGDF